MTISETKVLLFTEAIANSWYNWNKGKNTNNNK